jgi:O-antigen ligase
VSPWQSIQNRSLVAAGWAAAGLGFSLPVSSLLDGILLVGVLVAWAISGSPARLPQLFRESGPVLLLPGFFALVALGTLHGVAPFGERVKHLWKYNDFLLPLVFVPLFLNPHVRERALWGFAAGMTLTLVLSLLLATGLIPQVPWLHGHQENAAVFKHHLTHNIMMAFAALLFAATALRQQTSWRRYGLGALSSLAVADVFFFVQGRTGQVVLCALLLFWCLYHFGLRGFAAGLAVVATLGSVSYNFSPVFHARVEKAVSELERAQVETVAPLASSVGLRMDWYRHTAGLIAAHPVAGVGTGSFPRAYADFVTDAGAIKPTHPHNQYLLTAAELGVAGAFVLVGLFTLLWLNLRRAGWALYGELGQGVVIAMAIGCAFNSLLVDHTEGLFFSWMVSMALASQSPTSLGHT